MSAIEEKIYLQSVENRQKYVGQQNQQCGDIGMLRGNKGFVRILFSLFIGLFFNEAAKATTNETNETNETNHETDETDETDESYVLIFSTGGTILGAMNTNSNDGTYTAGVLAAEGYLQRFPKLKKKLEGKKIVVKTLYSIDSRDITKEHWHMLAKAIKEGMKDPKVEGIVILHGTDTMDQTAFLMRFFFDRRIVFTGAMKASDDRTGADGPPNIIQAISLAKDNYKSSSNEEEEDNPPRSVTTSPLVTMHGTFQSASNAVKEAYDYFPTYDSEKNIGKITPVNAEKDAFSPKIIYFEPNNTSRQGTLNLLEIDLILKMKEIRIFRPGPLTSVANLEEMLNTHEVSVVVIEGVGDGQLREDIKKLLNAREDRRQLWWVTPKPLKKLIIRASSTHNQQVLPVDDDKKLNCIASQHLTAHKAAIAASLFLAKEMTYEDIATWFQRAGDRTPCNSRHNSLDEEGANTTIMEQASAAREKALEYYKKAAKEMAIANSLIEGALLQTPYHQEVQQLKKELEHLGINH